MDAEKEDMLVVGVRRGAAGDSVCWITIHRRPLTEAAKKIYLFIYLLFYVFIYLFITNSVDVFLLGEGLSVCSSERKKC